MGAWYIYTFERYARQVNLRQLNFLIVLEEKKRELFCHDYGRTC